MTLLEAIELELETMESLLAGMLLGSSGVELELLEEDEDELLDGGKIDEAEELDEELPQEDRRSKPRAKKPSCPRKNFLLLAFVMIFFSLMSISKRSASVLGQEGFYLRGFFESRQILTTSEKGGSMFGNLCQWDTITNGGSSGLINPSLIEVIR